LLGVIEEKRHALQHNFILRVQTIYTHKQVMIYDKDRTKILLIYHYTTHGNNILT